VAVYIHILISVHIRWAMYMEGNIVACSRNHCSYEHTTGNSHSVVDLYVAVDSIKPLDVDTETQNGFTLHCF
jgi:hypothetical protein